MEEKQLNEDTEINNEDTSTPPTEEKSEPTADEIIEELRQQIKEKDDKYLRMAAEYDNFRRRSREEKEATYLNSLTDTVAQFLPLIDNLERAAAYDDGEKVKEGVVMIAKTTSSIFSALGVEEVGCVGEKFDPNLHNAVMHIEDDSFGEGEIVEVFQKGYKKGKHVIRFAMVKTAN